MSKNTEDPASKTTRSPEEVFKYHQETVLTQLKELRKIVTTAEKEFKFEPEKVQWEQSNNMRSFKNILLDMTETLRDCARKEFLYEKHDYKSNIAKQVDDFIKKQNETKPLSEKTQKVIDIQKNILMKSTPENFYKLRVTTSRYIGFEDKEVGELFKKTIQLPKLVEVKKEFEAKKVFGKSKTGKKSSKERGEVEKE